MPLFAQFDILAGPENINLVEREIPPPVPGEVQIKIRAAGLPARLQVISEGDIQPPRSIDQSGSNWLSATN